MVQFVVVLDKVSSEICETLAEEGKGLENTETNFINTNSHYRRVAFWTQDWFTTKVVKSENQ